MQTPPFLTKLYQLVNDPATASLVSWTDDKGLSFTVHKPSEFGRDVLPKYFKHNNFSSFVRQLNQYGFHKQNPDRWMFGHDSFRKDRPDLLKNITRRRPKQNAASQAVLPTALTQRSVVELGSYGIEEEVRALQRDKEILVKELVVTRQKEEQLKNRCEGLEGRVVSLEDTSKQMQAFIMHYFSQVLQPYSEAMASRKRKRLPASASGDDAMDVLLQPTSTQVANVQHPPQPNSSVDALRVMMQQMGVAMPPAATPTRQKAPSPPRAIANGSDDPRKRVFAPPTIQELPQDESTANGSSSNAKARANNPTNAPTPSSVPLALNPRPAAQLPPPPVAAPVSFQPSQVRGKTVAPAVTQNGRRRGGRMVHPYLTNTNGNAPATSKATPIAPSSQVFDATEDVHMATNTTEGATLPENDEPNTTIGFLEDVPNTPGTSMTMELIDSALNEPTSPPPKEISTGLDTADFGKHFSEKDLNVSEFNDEFDISFGDSPQISKSHATCHSRKDEEKAIEDFLELSSDDPPLPPPLTHLPEGTDIDALAKRIEGFKDVADSDS